MISRLCRSYCDNLKDVENYEKAVKDTVRRWECHHRLETHFPDGTMRPKTDFIKKADLVEKGLYWNRPPEELIFLLATEHKRLHSKGRLYSEAYRKHCRGIAIERSKNPEYIAKLRKSRLGKKASDETKARLSQSHLGKGLPWWTNGKIQTRSLECPAEGWYRGRLPNRKRVEVLD